MRWLLVSTIRRGVLDPPEPLDDEHTQQATLAWQMQQEAEHASEMEYRLRLHNQRAMAEMRRKRNAGRVRLERNGVSYGS